jgi:hypothetical protein
MIIRDHARVAPSKHFVRIDELGIAEAFPSSFLGLMIQHPQSIKTKRGNRSDLYFEELVKNGKLAALMTALLPGRQLSAAFLSIINHDERAALVSGITALCIAMSSYTAVGDKDGWIVLPPRAFIEHSAFESLEENSRPKGGLYVS